MSQVYMRPGEDELAQYNFLFWRAAGRPGPDLRPRGVTYADISEWAEKLGCSPRDLWIGKIGEEDPSAVAKIREGGPWDAGDPEVWVWEMNFHATATFLSVRELEPNGFTRREGEPKWIDYAYPVLDVRPYMVPFDDPLPVSPPPQPRKGLLARLFGRN